jgi:hypothetical protein
VKFNDFHASLRSRQAARRTMVDQREVLLDVKAGINRAIDLAEMLKRFVHLLRGSFGEFTYSWADIRQMALAEIVGFKDWNDMRGRE